MEGKHKIVLYTWLILNPYSEETQPIIILSNLCLYLQQSPSLNPETAATSNHIKWSTLMQLAFVLQRENNMVGSHELLDYD